MSHLRSVRYFICERYLYFNGLNINVCHNINTILLRTLHVELFLSDYAKI